VADLDRIEFQRQLHPQERPADAIKDLVGSIARAPFIAGRTDPRAEAGQGQRLRVHAAILPTGHAGGLDRNLAETGAGGFILPNDRVDVLLSKREKQINADGPRPKSSPPRSW